ncbi:hypothetical protein HAX54_035095 [Datura stramonium]|uniref:C2H2-type domain-containing protein n=1 Tax=Datura stramonium TaxID=4076 RepID=A0ABS8SF38_DATST|nr:hypothetical protein [Datura stramonium]
MKKDTFLAVAESYLEENGSVPLAKLIASKVSKPAIPAIAKLPDTSSLQVFQTSWTCEICNDGLPELTLLLHLRGKRHMAESKLWCAFCNLRCSSEIDMISHLKGKRQLCFRLFC